MDVVEPLSPDDEMDAVQRGSGGYIHPIFDKQQWVTEKDRQFYPRTRGAIPLLGGHEGCWVVSRSYHILW